MKISTFANPVRNEELTQIILTNSIPETVETAYEVDLEAVIEFAKEHPDDGALAEKIHNCLRYFPVSLLTDQCFWHWMTIVAFREYVLNRWGAEEDLRKWLGTPNGTKRFLGGNSIRGWNENAISRLFWTAEFTVLGEDDYHLTKVILDDTDLHKGLFDRDMGLDSKLLIECVRKFSVSNFADAAKETGFSRRLIYREAFKILSARVQTTIYEAYSPSMIADLVEDSKQKAVTVLIRKEEMKKAKAQKTQ